MKSIYFKLFFVALILMSLLVTVGCLIAILISTNRDLVSLQQSQFQPRVCGGNFDDKNCLQKYVEITNGLNKTADPCSDFYSFSCSQKSKAVLKKHKSSDLVKFSENIVRFYHKNQENFHNYTLNGCIALESCFKVYSKNLLTQIFDMLHSKFPGIKIDKAATLRSEYLRSIPWMKNPWNDISNRWIETPFFRFRQTSSESSEFEVKLLSGTDFYSQSLFVNITSAIIEKALKKQHAFTKHLDLTHEQPIIVLNSLLKYTRNIFENSQLASETKLSNVSLEELKLLYPKFGNFFGQVLPNSKKDAIFKMSSNVLQALRKNLNFYFALPDYSRFLLEYFWTFHKVAELLYTHYEEFLIEILSETSLISNRDNKISWCLSNVFSVHEFQIEFLAVFKQIDTPAFKSLIYKIEKVQNEMSKHVEVFAKKKSIFKNYKLDEVPPGNFTELLSSENLYSHINQNCGNHFVEKPFEASKVSEKTLFPGIDSIWKITQVSNEMHTQPCKKYYPFVNLGSFISYEEAFFWVDFIQKHSFFNSQLYLRKLKENEARIDFRTEKCKTEIRNKMIQYQIDYSFEDYVFQNAIEEIFSNYLASKTISELRYLTQFQLSHVISANQYYYIIRSNSYCDDDSSHSSVIVKSLNQFLVGGILSESPNFHSSFNCKSRDEKQTININELCVD